MNDRRNPQHNPVITHWHPEMLKKVGGGSYDGSSSGLDATTLKDAIDELAEDIAAVGSPDHGALTGLADDDHTQYLNETRHDALDHTGLPGVANGAAGIGPILITSEPAGSPLVFADLLQNSEGTDLLYASES